MYDRLGGVSVNGILLNGFSSGSCVRFSASLSMPSKTVLMGNSIANDTGNVASTSFVTCT